MDNANDVVTSGGTADRIDVAACTKAAKRLQTALSSMAAAGLGAASPVVTAAKKLVSNLNVRITVCRYLYLYVAFSYKYSTWVFLKAVVG